MASPSDFEQLSARARFQRSFLNNPAANANNGYFKVPDRTPPPAPSFEPPKPQKVSDSFYQRELRNQEGLTQGRSLNDNPGFRNPNPIATSAGGQGLAPTLRGLAPLLREGGPSAIAGLGLTILPGVLQQGPKYFDPSNPNGIFAPDPRYTEAQKALQKENEKLRRNADNALKNMGVPPWLNPFKNSNPPEAPVAPGDKPNAESKKWFPAGNKIKFWCTNNREYITVSVLSYSVTEIPKVTFTLPDGRTDATARNSDYVYLRAGKDGYNIQIKYRNHGNPSLLTTLLGIEPWTLENLGPDPGDTTPNPEEPENIVPETGKPFLPPSTNYGQEPPTILDPKDFKPPSAKPPLAPMFPPTLPPIPKPLDPIQTPEPTDPKEQRPAPIVPLPFNPFQTPTAPSPAQNPPPFEPGPVDPNQRLNDRGIFPARKADITSSASGSPLSPDVAIGGDPVRLKPAPTITKPKTPFETEEERKRKEAEKKLTDPFPLPLIPPVFPRPVSPTGTIDPNTADDITKSKEPPKPPVGTKPKCQDSCMAGLESGQASILDKLNSGVNIADTGLLGVINNKLGDQVPGGISGFLGKFKEGFDKLSDWLHLDRLLNILTFTMTVQNAYFLCDSLKVVTLQMVSDALSVIGIKDKEGEALNINKIIDDDVEGLLKKILGEEQLVGFKKEWKALNRIFQAGSNIISAVQSMAWSILNALDIIGSTNAQIGNALKKYKVLGERAFAWMNPAPNFHNKFFTATFNALNIVSNIDFVAQSIISARQGLDQIEQQSTEFKTDYSDLTNPKPNEHKPTATAETKAKAESVGTVASEADINNLH